MYTLEAVPSSLYDEFIANKEDKKFAIIPGFTVAGVVLPFVYKIGISTLKKSTAKKEEDYTEEYSSLNGIELDAKTLIESTVVFKSKIEYYAVKSPSSDLAAEYIFATNFDDETRVLEFSLLNSDEKYLPIKTKKKYDLVLEVFDFTVVAKVIIPNKNGKKVTKLMELGTAKISRILPSYQMIVEKNEERFIGGIIVPKHTESGQEIEYISISILGSVKYVNPIGTTQGGLNSFLEDNSEALEGLLNLTIESE